MHRTAYWCGLTLLGACSASTMTDARIMPTQAHAAAGSGAAKDDTSGINNPGGVLMTVNATPISGGAGSSGQIVNTDGCEIGKFCVPTTPDPDNCGTLTLGQDVQVKKVPGNLLVVFDQSLSMSEPWGNGGQTKLQAAQMAIANAVMSLQDSLTVGALFFPTTACMPSRAALAGGIAGNLPLPGGPGGPGGPLPGGGPGGIVMGALGLQSVDPIDSATQIQFQPAAMFLNAWNAHWGMPGAGAGIGTPMQEAFDRADAAIAAAQLTGDIAVLAVTDGEPNCFPAQGAMTDLEVNRAKNWLATKNIKTYVVGLPGAAGVQILNDVAMQGGTMQYILPDDPKMLEDRLRELVQETVKTTFDSCSIMLTPAADPADKLVMIAVEASDNSEHTVPHMLTPTAGWTISPDGVQVEDSGRLVQRREERSLRQDHVRVSVQEHAAAAAAAADPAELISGARDGGAGRSRT